MSLDDVIQERLGTLRPDVCSGSGGSSSSRVSRLAQLRQAADDNDDQEAPNVEFDARTRWPHLTRLPADQRRCAASWIYSAAGSL